MQYLERMYRYGRYGVSGISLCSGWGLRVQTLDSGDGGGKWIRSIYVVSG
jgi:hypothetical protein